MDVCKRSEESEDNVLNCTDAENFAYQGVSLLDYNKWKYGLFKDR